MHTFDFPFCYSPLGPIGIIMHFVPVKLSRNSKLLTNDPSKRGDVKTLAILDFPVILSKNEA